MLWLESIHDLNTENTAEAESSAPTPPARETPQDAPARAPENERHIAGDDTHLV